ncbi:MAG TPA: DNA helicase, partial [Dermatophilaceae bacterium]|nr:DNA helicase [Dermatophilaceae bacterium]
MTVAETIAGWARELSDVGGANTLLWAPTRRDCLLDLTTAHPGGVSMLLAGRQTRLSDLVREAGAFDEALVVARRIHDQTEDLLATRGLACGFVVIGVATWDPPRAGAVVEAPVLLRSCTLRSTAHASTGDTRADSQGQASQASQASQPDYVLDLGDNVEVNPALVNYLRSVAGIDVDPIALVGLAEGAFGFDPYPVYAALGRLCADVPGFSVTPRIVLGTYPYAKLDMVADVSANARWLAQVDLVAALAGDQHARDRLPAATPPVVDEPDIDREVAPLDLDPAQQSIIDAVRAGGSVVLDAPRGAGGTQTVAALVASAAYEGKSVLYVTTRSQSVRDLTARLREADLPDLVLDLLGADALGSSAVAAVVASLEDLTANDRPDPDARTRADRAASLTTARRALIDHVEALHERRMPWGVTAYEVQEAMAKLATHTPPPGSRVRISGPTLRELSPMRIAELSAALQSAAAAGAWDTGSTHAPRADDDTGPDRSDPWYGADISTDADLDRAQQILDRLAGDGFATRAKELDAILAESSLPPARTPADWERALRTMRGVRDTLEVFRPEIFDGPLDEHVAATGTRDFRERDDEVTMGWLTRMRVRRQTRRLLRPGKPPADLHAELISAREQRTYWFDLVGAGGRPEISPRLDEAQAAYDSLAADLHWLGERLAGTEAGGGLHDLTMPLVRGRLNHLAARTERLTILPRVTPVLTELTEAGMAEVLDDFARRNVAAAQVPTELEHIWWGSIGQEITLADP